MREYPIDERTTARVGFPDGHVELIVQLPAPFSIIQSSVTYVLTPEAIQQSLPALVHAAKILRQLGYQV